jgi:regulator of replication initiation timing
MDLQELEAKIIDLQNQAGKVARQLEATKGRAERLPLINKEKQLNDELYRVSQKIANIKRAARLDEQQAKRDEQANRQNNNTGRSRNRQRDIR